MASEPSYNHKADIQSIAGTLLQLSPIVLFFIYILEYDYAFRFLAHFGVSPEAVGISQIKLLTRAALLTLVLFSVYGLLFVLIGLLLSMRTWFQAIDRIVRILERRSLIETPKLQSHMENTKRAYKRAQTVRIVGTLSFALTIAGVILLSRVPPLGIIGILIFGSMDLVLTTVLFIGWSETTIRYLAWATGAALVIVVLGSASYYSGLHDGFDAAKKGHIPAFASVWGVDILQVRPDWLNPKVTPPEYSKNQDLLELGSDGGTAFLYDCWTRTTYRISLSDVVLTYPLPSRQPSSVILQRLRCR